MNLIVDIGNTNTKLAVFQHNEIIYDTRTDFISCKDALQDVISLYPDVNKVIISSVAQVFGTVPAYLSTLQLYVLELNANTPLPIQIAYGTPSTLGLDRIAALVAADAIFHGQNVLIFDFGTAITIDLLEANGTFRNGNISPGLNTRFRALNHFTSRLPLLFPVNKDDLFGNNTNEAIICGVQNGIVFEVKAYIEEVKRRYSQIKVIFSGGDADFFAERLKNDIFVNSKLVLRGLNRILEYNAKSSTK
jgi:type III pantothenate kinase